MAKLNLFNLEVRGEEISDDLSQRLGFESYQNRLPKGEPRIGQDLIRVITIDDYGVEALADVGWPGWPPGYLNLAGMIRDLSWRMGQVERKAVFFDFLISGRNIMSEAEEREATYLVESIAALTGARGDEEGAGWQGIEACQNDPLLKLACMVAFDSTPVVLATVNEVRTQARGRDLRHEISQVALLTPVYLNERNYNLIREEDGQIQLYPASALYLAYCLNGLKQGHRVCDLEVVDRAYDQAMSLRAGRPLDGDLAPSKALLRLWQGRPVATIWSSEAAPDQSRLLANVSGNNFTPCETVHQKGPGDWFREAFRTDANEPEKRVCEYHLWMGYDRLVRNVGLSQGEDLSLLFDNRIILVGSRFYDANDWITTPLHGRIPGVFYHAMVLDNLVELKESYRQPVNARRPNRQDVLMVPLNFTLTVIVLFMAMSRRHLAKVRYPALEGAMPIKSLMLWYLICVGLLLGGAYAVVALTRPVWQSVLVNWTGVYLSLITALIALLTLDQLKDLEKFFERRGWVRLAQIVAGVRRVLDTNS